jgi:hypothetical protein
MVKMTAQEQMELIRVIHNTIFESKRLNTDITKATILHPRIPGGVATGRWFVGGKLRGFDITLDRGDKTMHLRFMEQNPNKYDKFNNLSHFAGLARQGVRITWVIDQSIDGGWLGRIENNTWVKTKPRSHTTYSRQSAAPHRSMMEEIPQIPSDIDIPEYVEQMTSELESDYILINDMVGGISDEEIKDHENLG